jgi:Family of unknown function (DUF6295)
VCTYQAHRLAVAGSGKGADGWLALSTATVYVDHPVHAAPEHTLNIDFAAPERGAGARVAVELSVESAVRLVGAVAEALLAAPVEASELTPAQLTMLRAVSTTTQGATEVAPCPE